MLPRRLPAHPPVLAARSHEDKVIFSLYLQVRPCNTEFTCHSHVRIQIESTPALRVVSPIDFLE